MQNEFLKTNLIGLEKKYENRKKNFYLQIFIEFKFINNSCTSKSTCFLSNKEK